MHIALIGFGAVGYVLIQVLEEVAKRQGKVFTYSVLARNKSSQKDIDQLGIKADVIVAEDILHFLNAKQQFAAKVDWAINCAIPDFNISLLEWCISQKANYMDFASILDTHDIASGKVEQQQFHDMFVKHGLLGIVNAGISPGMTEILTAYMIKKENITPEKFTLYLKENFNSLIPLFSWSPSVAIDEMITPAYVRSHGKTEIQRPFTPHEISHKGKGTTYYGITQEEMVGIISRYDDTVKDMRIMAGGNEIEHMKLLYDMGLLSHDKIGDTTLIQLIKSKAPKAASRDIMIDACEKGLIDDAGFGFSIHLEGSGKKIRIASEFTFEAFNALKGTKYYGCTSVSYPTGVGAGYIFELSQSSQQKGIISCLDLGLEVDQSLIEKTILQLNEKGIKTTLELKLQ